VTEKTSRSPFRDIFRYSIDEEAEKKRIEAFAANGRRTVAIQGLGFVGSAMLSDRPDTALHTLWGRG
jgi:hypothetical protein